MFPKIMYQVVPYARDFLPIKFFLTTVSLSPGGRTTATAVENYITLFLLLFKASPWGTEAIYALNRWIIK